MVDRVRNLVSRYQLTGDDRLLDAGWEILHPALEAAVPGAPSLMAGAWLAQAGHEFDLAQRYLLRVVDVRPDYGEAWLLRASVALVQGDTDAAREYCRAASSSVPAVVTVACFARANAHQADVQELRQGYRRLSGVLAVASPSQPTLQGWLQSVLADLALRAGLLEAADEHFRVALQLTPTIPVRAGFADLLLSTREPQRVLDLIDPDATAPALVLRRMLAQKMLGNGPHRLDVEGVNARFHQWIAAGDLRHAREMAMFYLWVDPDLDLAAELAARNLRQQQEPEDRALLCAVAARQLAETTCTVENDASCGTRPGIASWPITRDATPTC